MQVDTYLQRSADYILLTCTEETIRLLLSTQNSIRACKQDKSHQIVSYYRIKRCMESKVINPGSDTFGNPIFQKGLQN